jgi:hypothetical protein
MWFFETYPEYNWEMILNVTKKYVDVTLENDVRYLQSSKYFIKKQDKNLEITSKVLLCQVSLLGRNAPDPTSRRRAPVQRLLMK